VGKLIGAQRDSQLPTQSAQPRFPKFKPLTELAAGIIFLGAAALISIYGSNGSPSAEKPGHTKEDARPVECPKKDSTKLDGIDRFLIDTSFYPKATIIEKQGLLIVLEKPGYNSAAFEMADIIIKANELVPPQSTVDRFVLRAKENYPVEGADIGIGMRYYSYGIYGVLDVTAETPRRFSSTFHEYSHCYFESSCVDTTLMVSAHEKMLRNAGLVREDFEKKKGAPPKFGFSEPFSTVGFENSDTLRLRNKFFYLYVEMHPLISLFDESSYMKKYGFSYGHPYDEPSELFASGSALLKFRHKEFFGRLKALWQTDPVAAAIGRQIARAIVQTWGDVRIFSAGVYKNLNLAAPPKAK